MSDRLWQLDGLSRWLDGAGLAVAELTPERVEQFLRARRAAGYVARPSRSMALPLRFLREAGLAPGVPARSVAEGPLEELLGGYRRYLACERGLALGTIVKYERVARLFLVDRQRAGGLALE
jgi:hypothetical protein